jgi:hypothetical protein
MHTEGLSFARLLMKKQTEVIHLQTKNGLDGLNGQKGQNGLTHSW